MTRGNELLPAESMALTVARSQAGRGDPVPPNTAMMLVMALDRLTGREDWTGYIEPPDLDDSTDEAD